MDIHNYPSLLSIIIIHHMNGGYQSITIHHYYDWISTSSGFIPLDPQRPSTGLKSAAKCSGARWNLHLSCPCWKPKNTPLPTLPGYARGVGLAHGCQGLQRKHWTNFRWISTYPVNVYVTNWKTTFFSG